MRDVRVVVTTALVRVRIDRDAEILVEIAQEVLAAGVGGDRRVLVETRGLEDLPIGLKYPRQVSCARALSELDQFRAQSEIRVAALRRAERPGGRGVFDVCEQHDMNGCACRGGGVGARRHGFGAATRESEASEQYVRRAQSVLRPC